MLLPGWNIFLYVFFSGRYFFYCFLYRFVVDYIVRFFCGLYCCMLLFFFQLKAVKVFAKVLGDRGSIAGRVIPKTQKMLPDASLLNIKHYKVGIKSKVEPSRESSSAFPYIIFLYGFSVDYISVFSSVDYIFVYYFSKLYFCMVLSWLHFCLLLQWIMFFMAIQWNIFLGTSSVENILWFFMRTYFLYVF